MKKLKRLGRRMFALFAALLMCLGTVDSTVFAASASTSVWDGVSTDTPEGSGTEQDPYQISTAAELAWMAKNATGRTASWGKYYELTSDIDLAGKKWTPIGTGNTNQTAFMGTFIGNGHAISNLNVSDESYAGLFGSVISAEICNLTIVNSNVTGKYAGAFVGYILQNGNLCNLHTVNTMITSNKSGGAGGGIAGYASVTGGTVVICCSSIDSGSVKATVMYSSENSAGGIMGHAFGNSGALYIRRSWCRADSISASAGYAGGILGGEGSAASNHPPVYIADCYNTANVSTGTPVSTKENAAGGIVGYARNAKNRIERCYNTGSITISNGRDAKTNVYGGGIVGCGYGITCEGCVNFGNVHSTNTSTAYKSYVRLGQIRGYSGSTVSNCFYAGQITANTKYYTPVSEKTAVDPETAKSNLKTLCSTTYWNTSGEYPVLKGCVPEGAQACQCGDCNCHCGPADIVTDEAAISGIAKQIINGENASDEVKAALTEAGITTGKFSRDGKLILTAGMEQVTLLYKITVTGDEGAGYIVTDADARWLCGDGEQQSDQSIKGILDETETAAIYVTRTFKIQVENGQVKGQIANTAYVEPDEGTKLDDEAIPDSDGKLSSDEVKPDTKTQDTVKVYYVDNETKENLNNLFKEETEIENPTEVTVNLGEEIDLEEEGYIPSELIVKENDAEYRYVKESVVEKSKITLDGTEEEAAKVVKVYYKKDENPQLPPLDQSKLTVTKEADNKTPAPGSKVLYTVTVKNETGVDLKVTFKDVMGSGLTFDSLKDFDVNVPAKVKSAEAPADQPEEISPLEKITFVIPNGGAKAVMYYATVSADAVDGTKLSNTVTVTGTAAAEGDGRTVSNTATEEVTVTTHPGLTVSKHVFNTKAEAEQDNGTKAKEGTELALEVTAGDEVYYSVLVKNSGDVTVYDIKALDSMDSGLVPSGIESVRLLSGTDARDLTAGTDYTYESEGADQLWTVKGELKPGDVVDIIYKATVTSTATEATLNNTVQTAFKRNQGKGISTVALGLGGDGYEQGGSDSEEITVKNRLTVTKTLQGDATAEHKVGDTVTWDIKIVNNSEKNTTVADVTENLQGAVLKDVDGNPVTTVTVPAKGEVHLTATYVVQPGDAGKTIANTVTVKGTGKDTDNVPEKTEPSDKDPSVGDTVTVKWVVPEKSEENGYLFAQKADVKLENGKVPQAEYPASNPTLEGKVFAGWGNEKVAEGEPGVIIIEAKWNDVPKYTVIWVDPEKEDPETPVKTDMNVVLDKDRNVPQSLYPATNPDHKDKGKEFTGWQQGQPDQDNVITMTATYDDMKEVAYDWGELPEGLGDADVTKPQAAKYKAGAEVGVDQTYGKDAEVTTANDRVYRFSGWTTQDARVDSATQKFEMPDRDVKFTGSWSEVETTPVKWFDGIGGQGKLLKSVRVTQDKITRDADGKVTAVTAIYPETPEAPEKKLFDGWMIEEVGGEIHITAQWIDDIQVTKPTVTVKDTDEEGNKGTWTEDPDNDKVLEPDDDGKVTLPGKDDITPPDGKELDKWTDGTNEYDPGSEITPTEDVTLTPVWKDKEPETITVTWKNGETGDILKEVQDRYPKGTSAESIPASDYPAAPEVAGKNFKEWTFEVDADGNITITATYEAKEDPAPVEPDPENPTPSIEDIRGLIQVIVTDAGATDHGTVTYQGAQIAPESVTIGNVRDNGDGTFSCDVTISPAWYVSSYNAAHGLHTLAAGQQPKTVTLSYSALADAAAEETGDTPEEEPSKVEAAEIEGEAQEAETEEGNAETADPEEGNAEAADPAEDNAEAADPEEDNAEAADPAEGNAEAADPAEDNAEAADPTEDNAEAAAPEEDNAEAAAPAEGDAEAADPTEDNAEAADPAEDSAEAADPAEGDAEETSSAKENGKAADPSGDSAEAADPADGNNETADPAEDSAEAADPAGEDTQEDEGIVELAEESTAAGKWTLANPEDGTIVFTVSCAAGTVTPDPTEPENPGTPEDPTDPTEPENPGTPEQPTDPTEPENPGTPEGPANPTEPENPGTPEQPTDPTDPENPGTPEQPTNPTGPVNPGTPEQPTNPANPAAPADTTPAVPAPTVAVTTPAATAPAAAAPAVPVPPTVPEQEEEESEDVDIPEEEAPQAEPEAEPENDPEDDPIVGGLEDLAEDETPLALGEGTGRSWALLNLILTILTALASLLMLTFYFVGKRREDGDEDRMRNEEEDEKLKRKGLVRLLSILPAAFAIITFILTEDMRNPMAFVDRWTLLMLLYAAVNAVLAFLAVKKWEKEEERVSKH